MDSNKILLKCVQFIAHQFLCVLNYIRVKVKFYGQLIDWEYFFDTVLYQSIQYLLQNDNLI